MGCRRLPLPVYVGSLSASCSDQPQRASRGVVTSLQQGINIVMQQFGTACWLSRDTRQTDLSVTTVLRPLGAVWAGQELLLGGGREGI